MHAAVQLAASIYCVRLLAMVCKHAYTPIGECTQGSNKQVVLLSPMMMQTMQMNSHAKLQYTAMQYIVLADSHVHTGSCTCATCEYV